MKPETREAAALQLDERRRAWDRTRDDESSMSVPGVAYLPGWGYCSPQGPDRRGGRPGMKYFRCQVENPPESNCCIGYRICCGLARASYGANLLVRSH